MVNCYPDHGVVDCGVVGGNPALKGESGKMRKFNVGDLVTHVPTGKRFRVINYKEDDGTLHIYDSERATRTSYIMLASEFVLTEKIVCPLCRGTGYLLEEKE